MDLISKSDSGAGITNRATPRKSLILVLAEGQALAPAMVSESLSHATDDARVDVILACAGPLERVAAIHEVVRDARVVLAPSGTSVEDLRELAIEHAPGDIVTLLTGVPV
jgi:hypothetical protein